MSKKIQTFIFFGVGSILLLLQTPLWWFGVGFVVAGVYLTTQYVAWGDIVHTDHIRLEHWFLDSVKAHFFPVAVISGLCIFLYPHAFAGQRPINGDHVYHFFKAKQLWSELLSDGQLFGWSHQMYAGYPAQYLYPIGADIWVGVLKLLSFGWLSFDGAYAIAFAFTWLLTSIALYFFGVCYFNRYVGMMASLMLLADFGSYRLGGFFHTSLLGVWPQQLALGVGLLAMIQIPGILSDNSTWPVALFGFLGGASIIFHPAQFIHLVVVGIILTFILSLYLESDRWFDTLLRLSLGFVICLLIAAFWFLPFVAVSEFSHASGFPWVDTWEFGERMFRGSILRGTWAVFISICLIGVVGLFRDGGFKKIFIATLSVVFFASTFLDIQTELHLFEFAESFQFVEYPRFAYFIKPYLFLAGSYAVYSLYSHVPSVDNNRRFPKNALPRVFALVLLSGLLLPVVVSFGESFYRYNLDRELKPLSDAEFESDFAKVVELFNREDDQGDFFRIGLAPEKPRLQLAELANRLDNPIYNFSPTPASNFKYDYRSTEVDVLRKLSVKFVVSTETLKREAFQKFESYGDLTIYEVSDAKRKPFNIIGGRAETELIKFNNDAIKIDVSEIKGDNPKLRLYVSHFSRWQAYNDGQRLPINVVSGGFPDKETALMQVPASEGVIEFRFERGTSEVLGPILAILGLILFALVIRFSDPILAWTRRSGSAFAEIVGVENVRIVPLALFGSSFAVFVALALWTPSIRAPNTTAGQIDVEYDLGERLSDAAVGVQNSDSEKIDRCLNIYSRHLCGPSGWQDARQTSVYFGDKTLHRCVTATARPSGEFVLHYPSIPHGDRLVGYVGIPSKTSDDTKGEVNFDVALRDSDSRTVELDTYGKRYWFDRKINWDESERGFVTFSVSQMDKKRQGVCFLAQIQSQSD